MKTCTYAQVLALAGDLLSRPEDRLPPNEAVLLRTFFAAQLPDLWNREAWPELGDHLEAVTLDASNCFSLREAAANEMGDLLALVVGGDPRLTTQTRTLRPDEFIRLDGRVNVTAPVTGGLYVDWQTPCPDLLDDAVVGDPINDYELPARFKLPLAALGAAHLIANEDPGMSGILRGVAESDLQKQASRLTRPWWRQ